MAAARGAAPVFATCSALRRAYRDRLRVGIGQGLTFLFLDVSKTKLARRLARRSGHFMGPDMLAGQLATLERPGKDETDVEWLSGGAGLP